MTNTEGVKVRLHWVQKSNARLIGEFQINSVLMKLKSDSQAKSENVVEAWFERIDELSILNFRGDGLRYSYEIVLKDEGFVMEQLTASGSFEVTEFQRVAEKLLENGIGIKIYQGW